MQKYIILIAASLFVSNCYTMEKVDPKAIQDLVARLTLLEKKVQVLEKQPSAPASILNEQANAQNYKVLDNASLKQPSRAIEQPKQASADSQPNPRVKRYIPMSGFHQTPGESDSSDEMY